MSIISDNEVLVKIYNSLESKDKLTFCLLFALALENKDHKVTLFLASEG